jgi:hypothetical protein
MARVDVSCVQLPCMSDDVLKTRDGGPKVLELECAFVKHYMELYNEMGKSAGDYSLY